MLRLSRSIGDEQRGGWLEGGIQLEDGMRRKGAGNLLPSSLLSYNSHQPVYTSSDGLAAPEEKIPMCDCNCIIIHNGVKVV